MLVNTIYQEFRNSDFDQYVEWYNDIFNYVSTFWETGLYELNVHPHFQTEFNAQLN